jgi:hypothetical protein
MKIVSSQYPPAAGVAASREGFDQRDTVSEGNKKRMYYDLRFVGEPSPTDLDRRGS